MIKIQVDDLQHEGEVVLHLDHRDNSRNIAEVKNVMRGDRNRVTLKLIGKGYVMTMKQRYIDNKTMELFRITPEENPEYFL